MKQYITMVRTFLSKHGRSILISVLALSALLGIMLYKLGSLVGSAPVEHAISRFTALDIKGTYHMPFGLPLTVVRVAVQALTRQHTLATDRLASVLFGAAAIGLFAVLIKFWFGARTAFLATVLFACNAWLLHVSRLASTDVLYLVAVPLLLVVQFLMLKFGRRPIVFYGSIIICGILLYVPGLVWFVALSLVWQRTAIKQGWKRFNAWWQRSLYVLAGVVWLPLLVMHLTKLTNLKVWLGLPDHFAVAQIGRQLAFVPVHLLIRGPNDPQRWLGHAPLLDAVSLAFVLTGIWFYATHFRATRSRLLGSYWLLGSILVGLGGSVGLSLLVPLLYILAAMGIAYLLHEWLRVFPINPIARKLGIGLVVVAIIASCGYNLRAYFVAWPHDLTTLATFRSDSFDRRDRANLLY